jgi:hypothetical protein
MSAGQCFTHHLDTALDDTPKLATADLHSLTSGQTACLEVPAELVKDRLLEITKDADRREKVVEVGLERIG